MGRIIGILGGMGPQATVDLMQWIIKLSKVEREADYPRVLVDNNPAIPDRTEAILYGGENPVPVLRSMLKGLVEAGAEIIGMPCNTVHYFIDEIREGFEVEIVDMLAETAAEVRQRKFQTVGLLGTTGTLKTGIYEKYLTDVEVVLPTSEEMELLMEMIYSVKRGEIVPQERLNHIITKMNQRKKLDGVILGCTELPLIAKDQSLEPVLINPTAILAQKLVELSQG
ncbi:hypothetical protein BBF96_11245 [Anoxybacter fermentans]|uniref:Aspartate racemase n=1 Tax=Anoxybacter fermentans TaxID=1323375 RepID=A0A3Q9HRF4_9FIRM|nr:amino acid racemase [Anoxybacter fermentans]AZR73915.1 hypothetical protein BBF96_11245 [Anoxybacter fermentans]